MSRLLVIAVLGALGWWGYKAYHRAHLASRDHVVIEINGDDPGAPPRIEYPDETPRRAEPSRYHCDGRTRCGQFSSCDEATWFIENCPGMKMDGDNDGVPCEDHLCPHN
jgi:hypothetical protein